MTDKDSTDDTWRRYALLLTVGQRKRLFRLELEGRAGREELLQVAEQWAANARIVRS